MLAFIVHEKEVKELEYVLKREMDEMLFDFEDERIDYLVKRAMEERYTIIFRLFMRITTPEECMRYARKRIH
ncbi:hypothetical protein [Ectobacillus polymachus]|uniref:hypothetical protein n=1 Tax=Ectobacillus polymachus TaxID=1508806 RepID=UPI003A86271D